LYISPGGKGANQAVTVSKLKESGCHFRTCLGKDEYGEMLSKNFKQLGIPGYFSSENLMGMAFIEATKEDQNGIVIFSRC